MFEVDPDIRKAKTPPFEFYADVHADVLRRAWHLAPHVDGAVGRVHPFLLGNVPVMVARSERGLACFSNVCTHRAFTILDAPACVKSIRCRYHGRRFHLDGTFQSMPEFEGVEGFPSKADDLAPAVLEMLGPIAFASLDPSIDFDAWTNPLRERTKTFPWDRLEHAGTKVYAVNAHWALYLENYLEGFHIPYVHAGLNQVIDYGRYRTETFEHGSVQIGIDNDGKEAGLYFWLFPTTMVNVYPWGLSLNSLVPIAADRTKVEFVTWVWDESKRSEGAGADLHTVELEDEAVVESVQRGIRSPLYTRGRYSPTREIGTHWFHQLFLRHLRQGHRGHGH